MSWNKMEGWWCKIQRISIRRAEIAIVILSIIDFKTEFLELE